MRTGRFFLMIVACTLALFCIGFAIVVLHPQPPKVDGCSYLAGGTQLRSAGGVVVFGMSARMQSYMERCAVHWMTRSLIPLKDKGRLCRGARAERVCTGPL